MTPQDLESVGLRIVSLPLSSSRKGRCVLQTEYKSASVSPSVREVAIQRVSDEGERVFAPATPSLSVLQRRACLRRSYSQCFCDIARNSKFTLKRDVAKSLRMGPLVSTLAFSHPEELTPGFALSPCSPCSVCKGYIMHGWLTAIRDFGSGFSFE